MPNEVVCGAVIAASVRLDTIAAFLIMQNYPSNSSVVACVLIGYDGLHRFFCVDDQDGYIALCMYSPDCLSTPSLFL